MEFNADGYCKINAITALNFMVETGAFEKMPREGSITAKELSEGVGIEESAIGKTYFSVPSCTSNVQRTLLTTTSLVRLMRILVGTGVILETGEDTYAHTPSSREYLPVDPWTSSDYG